MVMEIRKKLREQDWVYEKDCVACSGWPKAERKKKRMEGDFICLSLTEPVCARCWASFWQGLGACRVATKH